MAGIYIHIPYCRQACHYCDFHFSTDQRTKDALLDGLLTEMELQRTYLESGAIETIYLGGGTPSLLSISDIEKLVGKIHRLFSVAARPEFTMEVNPDDVTAEKLDGLRSQGVNRLSIGVQSFDDGILRYLNRAHDARQADASVRLAQQAGFTNISLDLIFAIPGLNTDQWVSTLNRTATFAPQHVSGYALTLEEKTVFGRRAAAGTFHEVDDHVAADQLIKMIEACAAMGLEQYEVSNFAKPGFESLHNSNYWRGVHYLGLGPGAHSYNGISRQANVSNNHRYIASLASRQLPATTEILSSKDRVNEYLMTSLRTRWGCDLAYLKNYLGFDLRADHAEYLEGLTTGEYARIDNEVFYLTQKGLLIADKIASDLFQQT